MKTAVSEIGNHPQAIKPQVFNTLEPDARRLMVAIATKFWSGNMTKNLYIPPPTKKAPLSLARPIPPVAVSLCGTKSLASPRIEELTSAHQIFECIGQVG